VRGSLLVIVLCALSGAVSAQSEQRHRFPISIANPAPSDAVRNGPLFGQIDGASFSTDGRALSDSLAQNAVISLYPNDVKISDGVEIRKFFHTLLKDCQGPYSIDEGKTWVQTSWVCHVGEGRLITGYFKFKDSPEISVEFTLGNGKINKVFAMEVLPLPIPGKSKHLSMNAAETIPDKRK
jgi:hypothetical protein